MTLPVDHQTESASKLSMQGVSKHFRSRKNDTAGRIVTRLSACRARESA